MLRLKKGIQSFSRVVLGILFASSGGLKLESPLAASLFFQKLLVVDTATSYAITISLSLIELIIGVLFIIRKKILIASIFASSLLLASTLVGILLLSNPTSCGCFGNFIESKTDEYYLFRNIIFFLISVYVFKASVQSDSQKVTQVPL